MIERDVISGTKLMLLAVVLASSILVSRARTRSRLRRLERRPVRTGRLGLHTATNRIGSRDEPIYYEDVWAHAGSLETSKYMEGFANQHVRFIDRNS
jgi:hypothetical protein